MSVSFRQAQLANGLTVIAEEDPAAHTSAVGFFVRTGARDEDRAIMGVSHFLEHMMFKGTERLGPEEVNNAFDSIGAEYNAFTTAELTAFHAHVLPEYLPRATELVADILRPALRSHDFDEEKGVVIEEIAMYDDNPFWVLYEMAMERYYGAHPLGHRVLGTRDTVGAMTRDQMHGYFDSRYSADNTVVAAAGRLDFAALTSQVQSLCAGWQRAAPTRRHPSFTPGAVDFTHQHKSAKRAYLLLGMPAPSVSDLRRYASTVLMQILGDTEGSRLYWSLVETGIAEEADASYDGRDGLGVSLVTAVCSPDRVGDVETVIRRELAKLGDSLTEDDLLRARRKIATSVVLAGERPGGRMQRLGVVWTYRREWMSLEEEMAHIEALTLKDLRACLADFPPQPLLVGRVVPVA